jgi:hypothetical protein
MHQHHNLNMLRSSNLNMLQHHNLNMHQGKLAGL